MFWNLLSKDLRRARANPWSHLIFLAIPILVTALVGAIFGPKSSGGSGLGQVKLAIVDEDESFIGQVMRSAVGQGDAKKYVQASYPDRAEAIRLLADNKLSAVVIIPPEFTASYFTGEPVPPLRLIKNPAQSFYPAIVEELLGVVVTGMNALARNFQGEMSEYIDVFEGEGKPDMSTLAALALKLGNKFEKAEDYLFPPLVTYTEEVREQDDPGESPGPGFNLFGYLLPGIASMFLLFIADGMIRDLFREVQRKTFDRYRTIRSDTLPFVLSKVVMAVLVLSGGGAILFGGGGLIFGIDWHHPWKVTGLVLAFALFASAFLAFLAAVARSERRADMIHALIIFGMSFAGGAFFPAESLPPLVREHISPWLPNYWFIEAFRGVEYDAGRVSWVFALAGLSIAGFVLMSVAAALLNRHLVRGGGR